MRTLPFASALLAMPFMLLTMAGAARAEPAAAPPAAAAAPAAPPPVASGTVTVAADPPLPPPTAPPPPPAPPPPTGDAALPAPGEKIAQMNAPPPPKPVIAYNIGVRVGMKLQDPDQPKKMSELHTDALYTEVRFHGDLSDMFGWVANFNAAIDGSNPTLGPSPEVSPMDMIVKFHAADAFNIWAGRLLVPSDRSNFTGPFFMSPWNYPGVYAAGKFFAFVGPTTGANGRDQGGTIWGMALDNKLKYYGGVYGIDQDAQPYVSGRVSYNIQGSEPGYFGSSTFYGEKSVFAVALSGQYQKNASTAFVAGMPTMAKADTTKVMVDALAEEVIEGAGTVSLEAQGYAFNGFTNGENLGGPLSPKAAFYLLAAYLTPENIGVGKFQPLVRVQQTIDPGWTVVDAQVAYVIKAYFLKLITNYQHTVASGNTANQIQFGVQMQM